MPRHTFTSACCGHSGIRNASSSARTAVATTASAAFTLIELLCVIAVIAILATILVPTMSRIGGTIDNTTCQNNLRSIAVALQSYAAETGNFPPSRTRNGDIAPNTTIWRQYLSPYLGGQVNQAMKVYVCPSRGVIPGNQDEFYFPSYALHPTICTDTAEGWGDPLSPSDLMRPHETILITDATQQPSGQSHTNFHRIYFARRGGDPNNANSSIGTYADPDPDSGNGAVFRYRHKDSANVAFADGHIGSFKRGTVLQKNVCVNY